MITRNQNTPLIRSLGMLVPIVSFLVATLFTILPIMPKIGVWSIMPTLPLAFLFLWVVFRPDLTPPFLVLAAGLFHDLATFGSPGVWAVSFLFFYVFIVSQRLYLVSRAESGVWVGFVVFAAFAAVFVWTLKSVVAAAWLNPTPFLIDAVSLIIVFPIVNRIFVWSQRFVGPPV